jgi:hypothetical protein
MDRFEKASKRFRRRLGHYLPLVTGGVGVIVGNDDRYFDSIAARMDAISAPEEYIRIASRATSRQTRQPRP